MPSTQQPQKNTQPKRKKKFWSLLTFVLLICIIELFVSAMNNINKNISFSSKIKGLEQKRDEELLRNKQLKSELENFDSKTTLESIARNNLKMAGENEILVIINKPQEEKQESNTKQNK